MTNLSNGHILRASHRIPEIDLSLTKHLSPRLKDLRLGCHLALERPRSHLRCLNFTSGESYEPFHRELVAFTFLRLTCAVGGRTGAAARKYTPQLFVTHTSPYVIRAGVGLETHPRRLSMQSPPVRDFAHRLYESLQGSILNFSTERVAKHQHVYVCGDPAESVYLIQSGQIKLLMLSREGKESLLAIHTVGDAFGELCLTGPGPRQETATAMEDTTLMRIPCFAFLAHLTSNSLIEGFVKYLAIRVADQQQLIANLITVDSEHRLGETLLLLARTLGRPDSRSTRIEQKITHEELSEMVGTTRPRITAFMLKFRGLGLIEVSPEHYLIVKETKLSDYLIRMA